MGLHDSRGCETITLTTIVKRALNEEYQEDALEPHLVIFGEW